MSSPEAPAPLLTVEDVCVILRRKRRTISTLVSTGQLVAVRLGTSDGLRFKPEDVEAYIEAHRAAPGSPKAAT